MPRSRTRLRCEAVASCNRLPAGYEAGICGREGKGVKKDAFKYFMKNSVPALIYANRERNPRAAAGVMARAVRTGREKCSSRNPNVRGGNGIREIQSDSRGRSTNAVPDRLGTEPEKKGARERNPQPKTGSRWRLREQQELQEQREW